MGRPIVATDRAILRDYVDDGVDAIPRAGRGSRRASRGDRAGTRRPRARSRLGGAARARVERDHTTRSSASGLATLIKAVV